MTVTEPRIDRKATVKHNRRGELWDEAHERIHREFPSASSEITWPKEIPLSGLFRLIGDIGTVGTPEFVKGGGQGGRGGHDRRREHPPEVIAESIRTVFIDGVGVGQGDYDPNDCSPLPFVEAFQRLRGQRTLMQMSRRTEISKYRLHRLATGQYPPTGAEMEAIASTFSKPPWYFREYRSTMIAAIVLAHMDRDPDRSAAIARELAS